MSSPVRGLASGQSAVLSVSVKSYSYRFFLSVCFFVVLTYGMWMGNAASGLFILFLLNLLFCADILFKNAWRDLMAFRFSLSLLTAVTVLSAFGYTLSKTFFLTPLAGSVAPLFLPVSALVTFYLWDCRQMAHNKERTKVFVKKLDDFLPKSGRLLQERKEMMVFAKELKEGDLIRVKPGERIPCEGILVKGTSAIDESLITGNMLPASKTVGSHVYAGTLNKRSDVWIKVEKSLNRSAINGIIDSIKNSERRRCVRRDVLDTFAPWMLCWALFLAAAAYGWFFAQGEYRRPLHTLGIFALTLGLGCPLSFFFCVSFPSWFVRLGAMRRKIKLQSLSALDALSQADVVFFDKTGTLTYGELRIASVHAADAKMRKELLKTLASAEQLVDGPFAAAINIYAQENKITPWKLLCFDVLPGLGVKAIAGKNTLLAGRPEWLEEQGVPVPEKPQGSGAVICGAKNGKYLGYVLLDDTLRPGAAEMVRTLRQTGKEVVLISGDNEHSALAMAKEAGIERVNFGVLPQTKAEILGNYAALGKCTVMVGDGFNDITALLRADAGVVFSSGRNVYNNWVDVIIKRADLGSVTELFSINKKLSARIRGNVLLCLLCNTAFVGWLLFAPAQTAAKWYWTGVGLAVGILAVFINSARLMNVK